MGRHLHIHPPGEHVLLAGCGNDGLDRLGRTRNDGLARGRIDRHRHSKVISDQCLGGRRIKFEQRYRALFGELRHQPRSAGDHPQSLSRAQRAGNHCSRDLAHRMADNRIRFNTMGAPQRRQRQLDTDQHRLDPYRAFYRLSVGQNITERKPQLRNEVGLQLRDGCREYRFVSQ